LRKGILLHKKISECFKEREAFAKPIKHPLIVDYKYTTIYELKTIQPKTSPTAKRTEGLIA
jgi:hypothetical protein